MATKKRKPLTAFQKAAKERLERNKREIVTKTKELRTGKTVLRTFKKFGKGRSKADELRIRGAPLALPSQLKRAIKKLTEAKKRKKR
jgi:hypothetical protein